MNPVANDWENQRAFLAVLREGSLSGAARALELAQPTVRRRIEDLEAALGVALFTRSPGGLAPTEIALALRTHAESMALAADAFVRSASAADEIAGTVRVTASEIIAVEILPAILAPLMMRHRELAIELSPSNRNQDVLRREADIAVRMVRPEQNALVARRVGTIPLGLHAHKDYLTARGMPATLEDVRDHAVIGVEHDSPILHQVQARGLQIGRADFAFRSDSDLAQLAALRAGLGIGICQVGLAARDPALVRLFADRFELDLETWVICHEDLRGSARVRVVFDALVVGLLAYAGTTHSQRMPPAHWPSGGRGATKGQ